MLIINNQLNNNLTKNHNIFIVFGEENLLIKQSLDNIYNYLKTINFSYKVTFDIIASSDFSEIYSEFNNFSVFATNKIIELRINTFAIKAINQLVEISKKNNSEVILVIIFNENITWKQQKTKWFNALNENSLIIQHKKIEEWQMLSWVEANMQQLNIVKNRRVAEIIASNNIYNLPSAYNELQKIKFIYGENEVDEEFIINQLRQSSKYSAYNLIDSVLIGNSQKVVKIYNNISDDIMYIINLLYIQINQLINIHLFCKKNISLKQAFTEFGVWQSRENIVKSALNNNPYKKLQKIILELGRIERSIKGRDYIMPDKLLKLLLELTTK